MKSTFAGGKVSASAAVFHIDWDDLQLNVPNPFVPGQFYIANVGSAHSRGMEFEVTARPHRSIDIFATLGITSARFGDGHDGGRRRRGPEQDSVHARLHGAGRRPAEPRRQLQRSALYGRGELALSGAFEYDEANTARQDAYGLLNFRAGARGKYLFAEAWVRNALDTVVRADRHPLPGLCAVGVYRREWPPAHLRRERGSDVLTHIREHGEGRRTRRTSTLSVSFVLLRVLGGFLAPP